MDLAVNYAHREAVMALESTILEQEQAKLEVTHHFSFHTYCRKMTMPATALVTGMIHRYPCTNILISGRIAIVTDELREEFFAGEIFESGAGVKKALYAVEESVFMTIHPWNNADTLEELEEKLTVASYEILDKERHENLEAVIWHS